MGEGRWLRLVIPLPRACRGPGPPPGALSLEDPSGARPRTVASGPGPPHCPFPLGVEGWPRPSPGSPCPRLGALGPPIPLALTDSARVRALINQRQARHGNKDGFLPRPRRLHIPLSPADSDGKKTAHAAHKRDETKMKRIEGAKRRGIFPLKHSNKYPAMII